MIQTKIKIPIYNQILKVIIADSFKYIEKKYNLIDTSNNDAFVFRPKSKNIDFIAVFEPNTPSYIIAHECLHLVGFVFNDNCIEFDINNDEPACYLLTFLVKEISNIIEQTK